MNTNLLISLVLRKFKQHKLAKELVVTSPNGVVEEKFVKIGGIEQWLTIRGEERHNPILFFVHGGPGSTYTIFTPLLRSWEKYFTIVQWDQRGSGKTFHKTGKSGTGELTFDRLTGDGLEITEFLRSHLGQEKIILVGSSAGSIIGLNMVKRRPDLFCAYVGTDQNIGVEAQRLSYQLTLDWLQANGNTKGVKAVERFGPDQTRWTRKEFDQMIQWTIKANPHIPNMITDIIMPALFSSPSHTFRDFGDLFKGMKFSLDQLYNELLAFDAYRLGLRFELPFFIFQGDNDALTPTAKAQEYFDRVEAPHKEFVLIEQSGHLAAFARPQQFLDELLRRVRPLGLATYQMR